MLAYLPLSLHSRPRILVMGFGGGTAGPGVALFSSVEQIDVVEIEPAVLAAAPYLQELNHAVDKDPG